MLACLRTLSLLAAAVGLADAVASRSARAVATYFIPESDRPEHKLVTEQLATLGIERFSPPVPPGQESDPFHLWSLVAAHQSEIDLVWSADAAAPPLDRLTFATTFSAKINHVPGSQLRLTNGDAFHQHILKNQREKEKFFFNFVPRYLVLPRDHGDMPAVFAETLKKVEYEMKREDDWFIYQRFLVRELPANGNDAALLPASVIVNNEELQAKLDGDLQGKTVEVTQYVEPYLIDGHKFQAGFYVAITSIDPLRIYYYGHPQIKIAKTAYPAKLEATSDPMSYNFKEYIAPWDFADLQRLYYEFPSAERPGTNSWNVLKRYMMYQGLDTTRLQKEIDAAIVTSIISSRGFLHSHVEKLKRFTAKGEEHADRTDLSDSFFELLRFDFELDDMGKPWLMRIHSNPSMVPQHTVFGSDEAIKKNLIFDLLNLVGVHPQAKPSFDDFFVTSDAKYCAEKCKDDSRAWDTTCWSCPGGFAPYVARRLFDSMNEYSRRGGFKLVYPSLDQDYSKFLDNTMSEHDTAFNRYIKSLSAAYAEKQDVPVFNNVVMCAYREHCNDNGDCINGKCVCDEEYEGATCYIPKDLAREKRMKEERAVAAARAKDSWMNNLWNRAPVPAQAAAANRAPRAERGGAIDDDAADTEQQAQLEAAGGVSGGSFVFGVLFVGILMYGGYQVYLSYVGSSDAYKDN